MASTYYKPCAELDECRRLIAEYYEKGKFSECFAGHMVLAEQGYPLAECQIGYFYLEGLGIEKDTAKALYWTERSAKHGDRDGQYNLAWFHEEGIGTEVNLDIAKRWYREAALQKHDLAIQKCEKYNIAL